MTHRLYIVFIVLAIVLTAFIPGTLASEHRAAEADRAAAMRVDGSALVGSSGASGLSLKDAVKRALTKSPMLEAMRHQVNADIASLRGNEGYPNPELSVETEDFLGSGVARGVDSLQVTAALSQEVLLGGKQGARRQVKMANRAIAKAKYAIAERQLVTEVADAFLQMLASQRRLAAARETVALAEETVSVFELKEEAGRATPIEVNKAVVMRSLALLAEDQANRTVEAAKMKLAAVCGEEKVFFDIAKGTLDNISSLPSLDDLMKHAKRHPILLAKAAEFRHKKAVLALEEAKQVPDLSVSVGYRWINATSDSAIVAGIAMPLPLLDRNQGPVGAAHYAVLKSEKRSEAQRLTLLQSLTEAYQMLAMEHNKATVLKKEIFPQASATFDAVREGYRIGRFGYLDLLDAMRTLFEVKEQTIEALIAYHRTAINLSRVTALPLSMRMFEVVGVEESETR